MASVDDKKARSKLLYMSYHSPADIRETTGVSRATLHLWITKTTKFHKAWKDERAERLAELIDGNRQKMHSEITDVFSLSMPLLKDSIKARINQAKDDPTKHLTIFESKQLAEIILAFDKLMRLDLNKPTEIQLNQVKAITFQELQEALQKDQFLEIKEVTNKDELDSIKNNNHLQIDSLNGNH